MTTKPIHPDASRIWGTVSQIKIYRDVRGISCVTCTVEGYRCVVFRPYAKDFVLAYKDGMRGEFVGRVEQNERSGAGFVIAASNHSGVVRQRGEY
jgi:hypothetical protein